MAYVTTNQPAKLVDTIGGGPAIWVYKSADVDDTVNGAGYITDAKLLGMRVNDLVIVADTTTPKTSLCFVTSLSASDNSATLAFAAVA